MFIALNVIFAIIVFAGVVGSLAWSIISTRTATQVRPAFAKSTSTARRSAYGSWESVNA